MSAITSIEGTTDVDDNNTLMKNKVTITNKLENLRKKINADVFDVSDEFYAKLCNEANLINSSVDISNKID